MGYPAIKDQHHFSKNARYKMICDSVLGLIPTLLKKFSWAFANQFKRGGVGVGVSPLERVHILILQHFTFGNQHLIDTMLIEDNALLEQCVTPVSHSNSKILLPGGLH
ncbi:hypothetical protein BDZ94DRAFT_1233194 [Collybia nuda]|uniref:Uncharacterized protein n=1 Tax=Collybia nuda TaxID=64659 RepID=A0A9P6CIJ0_9AGAR|nr:hypothetical protein BDZ94DRAFT_1233194 [Collybia nuda]